MTSHFGSIRVLTRCLYGDTSCRLPPGNGFKVSLDQQKHHGMRVADMKTRDACEWANSYRMPLCAALTLLLLQGEITH